MPSRKRRSNRLTVEQLEAKRELRERDLNQSVVLLGLGQEIDGSGETLYRSVSLRMALQMVREGDAEKIEVETDNGATVVFRELCSIAVGQLTLPMMPNAKSADALSEYIPGALSSRLQLRRVANVLLFPFAGDSKNPLTGPRVSDIDRDRARKLLGGRPATAGHCYRPTRVLRNSELAAAA